MQAVIDQLPYDRYLKTLAFYRANLYEAADIMKDLGAINAINLDGGGSSTLVINNTLVNHPSDSWYVTFLSSGWLGMTY